MIQESTPVEIYQRAKKNKHTYNISTEAFTSQLRQFVVHNLSLKKDYTDIYDIFNFRRGLAYIQEIVDFKNSQPLVARKGLRKFKDLLPQYLDLKQSHINNSKYHFGEKQRLFKGLQENNYASYVIYNTQKLNGENAQFSYVFNQFWVIGTKNKVLIVSNQEQLQKLKNKHQHKLTILIARAWFALLKSKTQHQIQGIKLELSSKTLIGQYCNSTNMQHLVDYGKQAQLYFYALVEKDNLIDNCQPTSTTFKFLDLFGLPKAKCSIIPTKSFEETVFKLREIVIALSQVTMKQGGQGGVIYVSGVNQHGERNELVCKAKTIQYRIYRKLREKLKIYIQKYNKNYDNLLKKFSKQIIEIGREFKLNKPLQQYIQMGRRSFILCQDQSKLVSKFIGNRFIHFLQLVQKNISKQKFIEICSTNDYENFNEEQIVQNDMSEEIVDNKIDNLKEQEPISKVKRVLVLIPMTIPSTGKTTLLSEIYKSQPNFRLWSVSSDEIKRNIMDDLRKKKKNLSKEQAFQKSRQATNKQFFKRIGEIIKQISLSKQQNHVFYLDKNHPQNALKKTIQEINQKVKIFSNIKLLKLGLFPFCQKRFQIKGTFRYPFSIEYILTCLKRVLLRPEHLTLEGSDEDRIKIVFGFANLFRNFSLSPYNIKKYFDEKIQFQFNNEHCVSYQQNQQLIQLFKQILLSGKPGNFDLQHPKLNLFVEKLRNWELKEQPIGLHAQQALKRIQEAFERLDNVNIVETNEQKIQIQ